MHVVNVEGMRELEARAASEYGLTSHILMENAGKSAAEILAQHFPPQYSSEGLEILLLIGPGNNGGDGLVVARYLEEWGHRVSLYRWKERQLAVLGTGTSRPLTEDMRALLARVQQEREKRPELQVVAIDLPTGLNADTGEVDP